MVIQEFSDSPVEGAPWAFVAVMGVTGSGKSTFIQTVSGNETIEIGNNLKSCTSELKGYSFFYKGFNINLVDTPGFNDTFRSETEVLQDIADWLKKSYEGKTRLHGIIYLHSINNVRMEGSAIRNLKMFRQLCGNDPLKNVVLATTFWGVPSQDTALAREQELRCEPDFWGDMLGRGSSMKRVTDRQSCLDIVSALLEKPVVTLKIQRELVEEDRDLIDTSAGQTVNEELVRLAETHKRELEKLQKEMQDAIKEHDDDMQLILRQQEQRLDRELAKVQRESEQLRYDRRAERRRWENDVEERFRLMKVEHEENMRKQELSFEQAVALVRANESKLQAKELEMLEEKIKELTQKLEGENSLRKDSEDSDKGMNPEEEKLKKKKSRGSSKILFRALSVIFPITTLALLGIPIPSPFSAFEAGTA